MNIARGTIICARIQHPEGRGRDLERFYLVISPTEENTPGTPVICLGISTQCPSPPPAHAILLPFSPKGAARPMTGLYRRCAVFVDWIVKIPAADISSNHIGHVRPPLMAGILRTLDEFHRNK